MGHEDLIGKHTHLFAKPENYTQPTKDWRDCICGGMREDGPRNSRSLIANCPCCDGVQILVVDVCDCPDSSFIKFRVVLPPDSTMRIRRIENVEAIK
jgi:hypothetical protein